MLANFTPYGVKLATLKTKNNSEAFTRMKASFGDLFSFHSTTNTTTNSENLTSSYENISKKPQNPANFTPFYGTSERTKKEEWKKEENQEHTHFHPNAYNLEDWV